MPIGKKISELPTASNITPTDVTVVVQNGITKKSNINNSSITNHSQLNLDDGTNPHGTTKIDIGLGNVDNTSDINKPISNAIQIALDTKVDKVTGYGLSKNDFTDLLKLKLEGIFYKKITTSTAIFTGTLSPIEVFKILIPANSLASSDVLNIHFPVCKINTNAGVVFRLKLSQSITMPSGTLDAIATYSSGNAALYIPIDRRYKIDNGNIYGYPFAGSSNNDFSNAIGAISSIVFDHTVDNYLYLQATLSNVNDQIYVPWVKINNI